MSLFHPLASLIRIELVFAMMSKEKIDLRPVLVKVGVAVALSFAGLNFARFRGRKNNPSSPIQPPHSSDHDRETDEGEGLARHRDNSLASKKAAENSGSITLISSEKQGGSRMVRAAVDSAFSPSSKHSEDKDGCLLPEFNDLVRDYDFTASDSTISPKKDGGTPRRDVETLQAIRTQDKEDYEKEIIHLKNMVRMLRERERNLEVQLLEFYGLKEQETAMLELQNRLKVNSVEAKFLNLKIESLQADNQRLHEQVADYRKVVSELGTAREKIRMLRKKLKFEAEQNREKILTLQKRVMRLQEQEQEAASDHVNLEKMNALETEAEELRSSNMKLQLENSELARQLESTQVLANSVLEDPETESLKLENEELAKKVERLQADRCTDLEELVYLRWVNACLRYELRNFQPPHGKTVARDLSKTLSPKSEEHVKKLILEYAETQGSDGKEITSLDFGSYHWPSSQASYTPESGDFDDSFLSPKGSGSSKVKFFRKLRRLIGGKDKGNHDNRSTPAAEDSDSLRGSPCISTTTDSTSDFQSGKTHTPSLNLSRHSSFHSSRRSLDVEQTKSMKVEDLKDMDFSLRSSDAGSSFGRRLKTPWGSDFSEERQADQEQQSSFEKSQLVKFAEALTPSGSTPWNSSRTANRHRKSASVGSFEPLTRS